MLIHSIKTEINKKQVKINLPDKKSIILQGQSKDQVMYMIECCLIKSYMGYYDKLDKIYGFDYKTPNSATTLLFNQGEIIGKNQIIETKGVIPNVHCIRYLGNGVIRSSLNGSDSGNTEISYDMTKYNVKIPQNIWARVVTLVNKFFDRDVVVLTYDYKLVFNFSEENMLFEKLVYQLVSECCLTPAGYKRILLLSNMNVSGFEQIRLISMLDNIKGHSLCLSTGDITFKDVSKLVDSKAITFLRV